MNTKHGITDTGKLKTIEIDKYESIPGKPGVCRAVGQASKQEVFDQLKEHLAYVGMLPDEYFLLSRETSESIPDNWRGFACNVSFGGSEGIYLDISLNTANGSQSFITGKTLSEGVEDFLNMSRVAAECNLMLNGNGCLMALPQDIAECLEHNLAGRIEKYDLNIDFAKLDYIEIEIRSDEYVGGIDENGHERKDNFRETTNHITFFASSENIDVLFSDDSQEDSFDNPIDISNAIERISKYIDMSVESDDVAVYIKPKDGERKCFEPTGAQHDVEAGEESDEMEM